MRALSRAVLTPVLAVVLAVGVVLVPPAAPAQAAPDRTVTYTISTRGAVTGSVTRFGAVATEILADPRGWSLGGALGFRRVSGASDFDLILASPAVIAAASPGCSSYYSCRVGRSVYINDARWLTGTPSWPHDLYTYRRYVILHEVGHWLGMGHRSCRAAGWLAPAMQQQSISLQGCRANMLPTISERAEVGARWGVAVRWSPIEALYRALGQEGSLLGHAIDWDRPSGIAGGRYQRFRSGTIHWSASTGAHSVRGALDVRHRTLGGVAGPLGYPTTNTMPTLDRRGLLVRFAGSGGGSIYWSATTGAREVYGPIHAAYAARGYASGPLGLPRTGRYSIPGGYRNDFEGGYITQDAVTGATRVVLT